MKKKITIIVSAFLICLMVMIFIINTILMNNDQDFLIIISTIQILIFYVLIIVYLLFIIILLVINIFLKNKIPLVISIITIIITAFYYSITIVFKLQEYSDSMFNIWINLGNLTLLFSMISLITTVANIIINYNNK